MAGYDGSIRVQTDLDTKNAKVQLASLQNRMAKTADKINALRSKMDAMKDMQIPTQEYSELQKYIENTGYKLAALRERQERFLATGGKEDSTAYKRMAYDIDQLKISLTAAQADMQNLVDEGKAFTLGSDTEEYAKIGQQLGYLESDMDVMVQKEEILKTKAGEIEKPLLGIGASLKKVFSMMAKGLLKDIPIAALKAGGAALISIFGKLGNVVKNTAAGAMKSFGRVAKNALSKLIRPAQKSKEAFSSMSAGIKKLLPTMLIFNMIRKAFRSLISSMKEGFTNLYNANDNFKSSIDGLKASMLTLKNSFATAFSPLIEVAVPYIQLVVDWLSRLMGTVGQFMAAVTGQKTYTKAIKQTTAALKDENKASNRQLSSLDKLNNLSSGSGDSGAGASGGMFEEQAIADQYTDIAQWLKDMWADSDFYDLGSLLGEKLKNGLDSIPWNVLKSKVKKIGKSITSLFNGFIEVKGLGNSIGKSLAEAVNTGFTFLNSFVHGLNWDSVGAFIADTMNGFFYGIDWDMVRDTFVTGAKGIGDAINSFTDGLDGDAVSSTISNFFNTVIYTVYTFITTTKWEELGNKFGNILSDAWTGVNWTKAGETVGEAFKAFFDFISSTIEGIDWWAVGESVKNFLIGIDWAGVAESFFEAVGAALGGFAAFIGGLISDGIEDAKSYFKDKIEEAGGDLIRGIYQGIKDAVLGIAEWIYDHVFKPFIDGFKKAFGIHSPSTVMAEMGGYLIEGLLNGLKNAWIGIATWIADKAKWLADKVKGMFSTATQTVDLNMKILNSTLTNSITGGGAAIVSGTSRSIPTASSYSAMSPAMAALSTQEIPGYATGQVIPRTMKKHLAYLGDNNQETEVVSPLSTIRQALREEIGSLGLGNGGQDINLNLTVECEGYPLLRIIQKLDKEYFKQTGKHVIA